ncbi:MAG: FtsX-like permease family protein [Thermomicrobiales bacterium]|nr:FtsX-like permease family protein [Thermomicrobiales bacterium]MCO5228553.1 FtsX-like permease family protein [Thermomicrobiales bacterium]
MLQQLHVNWKRTVAVFLAVLLGIAFVTASLFVGSLYNNSMRIATGNQVMGADLVVTSDEWDIDPAIVDIIAEQPGVSAVDNRLLTSGGLAIGSTSSYLAIGPVPQLESVRSSINLKDGLWPTALYEIVISEAQADSGGLTIGDTVTWSSWDNDQTQIFTVVGISPNDSGIALSVMGGFVTPETFTQIAPDARSIGFLVDLAPSTEVTSAVAEIQTAAGPSVTVRTFDQFVDEAVSLYAGGTVALQVVVLGFAVIAMIAAGIVIANSFEISFAQRTRELGLLRSIGATSRQIRRMILLESATTGAVASMAGTLLGIGLIAALNAILFNEAELELVQWRIAVPLILGVVVTMLAALSPSRAAMRVQPLQAIRQTEAPVADHRASRIRKLSSALLVIGGFVIMGGGVVLAFNGGVETGLPMLIGIVGGAISFLGVLTSAGFLVPAIAELLGRVIGDRVSVTGELAFSNINRNPRRTASTSAALLMGVTLITMMAVGVSMMEATLVNVVNTENPIDLEIEARDEDSTATTVPIGELLRWRDIDGVDAFAETRHAIVTINDGYSLDVTGIDLALGSEVLRTDILTGAGDGSLVINDNLAMEIGVETGDTVTVIGADGAQVTLVVIVERGIGQRAVVSQSTLATLAPDTPESGAWIRLNDRVSPGDVLKDIRDTDLPNTTLDISGSAASRAEMLDILNTVFLIALGLLAVSIIIAVVGIGNTLTLSVIERSRETGMLRAMGLKRGQVRTMLATEGVLIALIGCGIGLVLGGLYGIAGIYCVIGDAFQVTPSMPWLWFVYIVVAAVLSGIVASIIPAQRSLKVKPVEALATVG